MKTYPAKIASLEFMRIIAMAAIIAIHTRLFIDAPIINGHALPAMTAALNYHNMRRTGRSTANMIQGLRDYFGAHTFERIDDPDVKVNGPWHD